MRVLLVCFFLLTAGSLWAQHVVNQTDAQGRKQGYWTKKDAEGRLLYQATFKNDQPVGEMKRFHPNGKIKAVLVFTEGSETSEAQLFDERGKLIAEGKYIGQKKTGLWKYLVDGKVMSTETYIDGQKSGTSKRFYSTGELLEEAEWLNGQLHGIYRSYFQDGKPYLECKYAEGKRNGVFKTSFPNGAPELDAFYTNDLRDKDWQYFDETGRLLYTLKFEGGNLLNPEVQDSIDAEKTKSFRTRTDQIPDPEKFMQNPEEYMRLMQIR